SLDPQAGHGRLRDRFWYGLRPQISSGACYEQAPTDDGTGSTPGNARPGTRSTAASDSGARATTKAASTDHRAPRAAAEAATASHRRPRRLEDALEVGMMETILVKIFAMALALSQVATTPDAVRTRIDRVRDQEQVA